MTRCHGSVMLSVMNKPSSLFTILSLLFACSSPPGQEGLPAWPAGGSTADPGGSAPGRAGSAPVQPESGGEQSAGGAPSSAGTTSSLPSSGSGGSEAAPEGGSTTGGQGGATADQAGGGSPGAFGGTNQTGGVGSTSGTGGQASPSCVTDTWKPNGGAMGPDDYQHGAYYGTTTCGVPSGSVLRACSCGKQIMYRCMSTESCNRVAPKDTNYRVWVIEGSSFFGPDEVWRSGTPYCVGQKVVREDSYTLFFISGLRDQCTDYRSVCRSTSCSSKPMTDELAWDPAGNTCCPGFSNQFVDGSLVGCVK